MKKIKGRIGQVLIIIVLVGSLAAAGYFYSQWNKLRKTTPQAISDENTKLVETVGKIILLPTGEQPTIATVTDPSKLTDQNFFANAKVGDKVLVYATAKTAYLFDPTANKIINVAPITTDQTAPSVSGAKTQTKK